MSAPPQIPAGPGGSNADAMEELDRRIENYHIGKGE